MRKKYIIGLFCSDLSYRFQKSLLPSINKAVKTKDISLLIFPGHEYRGSHNHIINQNNTVYSLANNLDGIIISSTVSVTMDDKEKAEFFEKYKDIPKISLGCKLDNIPSVYTNNRRGMKQIVNHLIVNHNCRKILFVYGFQNEQNTVERYNGYCDALLENGIPIFKEFSVKGEYVKEIAQKNMQNYLDKNGINFDGVAAVNDETALGVIEALNSYGYGELVPNEIPVTGFDHIPDGQINSPSLTTVSQNFEELCNRSVNNIISLIEGNSITWNTVIPVDLKIYYSCGCKPETKLIQKLKQEPKDMHRNSLFEFFKYVTDSIPLDVSKKDSLKQLCSSIFCNGTLKNKEEEFLVLLNTIEKQHPNFNINFKPWLEILLELHSYYLSENPHELLSKTKMMLQAIELPQYINKQKYDNHRTYLHHNAIVQISSFFDKNELLLEIFDQFNSLGIKNFHICLFNKAKKHKKNISWTLPEESRLILSCTNGKSVIPMNSEVSFLSNLLLPTPSILKKSDCFFVVKPLFVREEQLGFCLLEYVENDLNQYTVLVSHLSNILKTHIMYAEQAISNQKLARFNEELQQLIISDELTGLYNRQGFINTGKQYYMINKQNRKRFSLIYVHIHKDRKIFKEVNNRNTNELIKTVAKCLTNFFDKAVIIGRVKKYDFAIILNDDYYCNKLDSELSKKIYGQFKDIDNRNFRLSISLESSENTNSFSMLLSKAENATIITNETPSTGNSLVNSVITYLKTHLIDDINIEYLSLKFNTSASYLSRLFKNQTGIKLIDYITDLKLSKAKWYLENTKLNITTIAYQSGYNDSNYFCRIFKKKCGISPSSYRKKCIK